MAGYNSSAAVSPSISARDSDTTDTGSSLHKRFLTGGVIAGVLLVIPYHHYPHLLCVRIRNGKFLQ